MPAIVEAAVLKFADNEPGRKMLKSLKIEKPIAAEFERDYCPVEKLALKMYAPLLVKEVQTDWRPLREGNAI